MTSVHIRDVAERCYGPFSHRSCTYLPVFARIPILLGLGTPSIVPVLCAISHRYPAREPKHAHAAWPTAMPLLSFAAGLCKNIHGSLYLWGRSVQEMGGDVVIGRSIYEAVVIDGSLYSRFYGTHIQHLVLIMIMVAPLPAS